MELTDTQKMELFVKYQSGLSIAKIAEDMKINKSTVNLWLSRYKEAGNFKRKIGSGTHKKIIFN